MAVYDFHIKSLGTDTILIQWSGPPSDVFLHYLLRLKECLQKEFKVEVIHTYQEILLKYFDVQTDIAAVEVRLGEILNNNLSIQPPKTSFYKIPVCYEADYGSDMEAFAKAKNLTVAQVIALHTAPIYTIYFMGFLPGFPYLEGLDERLHLDRKSTPTMAVPRGSIAIGGKQTGIYPQSSPGGWHSIGHTPVPLFDQNREEPLLFKAGDTLQFYAIDKETHERFSKEPMENYLQISSDK